MNTKSITPSTMIPLSFLAILACGMLWVATLRADLSHASSELLTIKEDLKAILESRDAFRGNLWDTQRSIDKRLSKIEGQLDVLVFRLESRPP